MITNSQVLSYVTFIYGLAGAMYLFAWIFHKEGVGKAATWVTLAAVLGNTAGIILRWVESYAMGSEYGHAPLTNLYESLTFFSWTIGAMYLYIERRFKNRVIGAFCLPLACLSLAYASFSPGKEIEPLIPALKSNWLIAHVFACFIGYAAFAIAFAVSIAFLIKSGRAEPVDDPGQLKLMSAQWLDELTQQLIMFGFLFLTVGIITGAVWANSAWGRYWGWDPKETWSLITWFIYAAMLHFRLMRGWRGRR
ncbi:MAG: c-type cytochrome biogenesis protein CcsB, partial [Desulfosarcinaceae bacterium]